jgi:glucose/mannose-6-phosphate isomerase
VSLGAEAISRVDSAGMAGDVLHMHAQLADAVWRVESAALPATDAPGGLAVCGMGGSAIGADLAAAAIGDRAKRPLRTVRGYELEPWASDGALTLVCSYSGNTEEALACFEQAGRLGAPRVAMTTGGELAERARAAGVPVIGVPSGMQPRAAVAYATVGALECAALCGAAPSLRDEIEAAGALLERLAGEWGPDSPDDSRAKRLALTLRDHTAVIYGGGATAAPALRWKTQVNENAKRPAFASVLPEADHNEICGWDRPGDLAAVFLVEPGQPEWLSRRVDATADVIAAGGAPALRVPAAGDTSLERVLSLVLLGDLVSVYLAVLDGVDPTPVEPIERLKGTLSQP